MLKKQSDFLQVSTIRDVQTKLCIIDQQISKKKKHELVFGIILFIYLFSIKRIRELFKSYFMEVVSSLCFGQMSPPEPALIKELLNVVFTEQDTTKDFTYSDKEKTDKVPVIRSFLLQLLLEHK